MVSVKKTTRLSEPEMMYIQEKIEAESSNMSRVIRSCIKNFDGNEGYFPKELIRSDDNGRFEGDRVTFRLEEDIYRRVLEKSETYCGGSFSEYVRCAIGYNLALDEMGVSGWELSEASYNESHDSDLHSVLRIGHGNFGLTVAEYKQALIGKHYRCAIERLKSD